MDSQNYTVQSIRKNLTENNLEAMAIVQDIVERCETHTELEALNEAGRAKLALLRKNIERLDDCARDSGDPELAKEVDMHRNQFSNTLQAFRKANVKTLFDIEKANREQLMALTSESDFQKRKNTDNRYSRSSVVSQESDVTEKMLAISRHLSETTQKSADTLEALVASSQNVQATRDELRTTAGTISQSGNLLRKYGRRECTDKMLLFSAFVFFLACVVYILHKRLF